MTSKNSMYFKAIYQDYDWCYQKFIIEGLNHQVHRTLGWKCPKIFGFSHFQNFVTLIGCTRRCLRLKPDAGASHLTAFCPSLPGSPAHSSRESGAFFPGARRIKAAVFVYCMRRALSSS